MAEMYKLKKKDYDKCREALRQILVYGTNGCEIQNGWPCGTCTCALLNKLGLDSKKKEYRTHNDKVDRINEVWRALIQIREHDSTYQKSRQQDIKEAKKWEKEQKNKKANKKK